MKESIEKEILRFLKKEDFHGATQAANGLAQWWGVPLGDAGDKENRLAGTRTLEIIFSKTPTLIKNAPQDYLRPARLAAGLYHLLGEQRSKVVKIADVITPGTTVLAFWLPGALISHAVHLLNVEYYSSMTHPPMLRVRTCNDDMVCPHCAWMHNSIFSLDKMPELPFVECESPYGCRCYAQPIVK